MPPHTGHGESVAHCMGLEYRDGTPYYYRKVRKKRRVVSAYVGSGAIARLAYQLDQMERERRDTERMAHRVMVEQLTDSALLKDYRTLSSTLIQAAFVSSGYHRHKRSEWRKRRAQVD